MKPQSALVLSMLRLAGPAGVTQQDAIRRASVYRLAARISDLRADGFLITSEAITDDHGHRFARYTLHEQPEQLRLGVAS